MSVLITGGTKGVGRATALRFAQPGTDVFINYHADAAAADVTAAEVTSRGARAHLIKSDVTTAEGVKAILRAVGDTTDHLDVVVHCAVNTSNPGSALTLDPTAFAEAVHANGSAILTLAQCALPFMTAGGSIIFVTSRGSHAVVPGYVAVGAPKALGEILIKYLAVELAPLGIRANSVMGSAMDTDALRSALPPGEAEARLRAAAESNPSGRRIEIDELVDAIEFLVSDRARMIQGQRLTVDGGFYLR